MENLIIGENIGGRLYFMSGISALLAGSARRGQGYEQGICASPDGNLITCDHVEDHIYIHSGVNWDNLPVTVGSFTSPHMEPQGVAIDHAGNLVSTDSQADFFYIHSGISNIILGSFSAPDGTPRGIIITPDNDLISIDHAHRLIFIHSGVSNTVTGSFSTPNSGISDTPSDLGFTLAHNLLSTDNAHNHVYLHSGISDVILGSIQNSGDDIYGVMIDEFIEFDSEPIILPGSSNVCSYLINLKLIQS